MRSIYLIEEYVDNEGRTKLVGAAECLKDAEAIAKSLAIVYGNHPDPTPITLFESFNEFYHWQMDEARRKALTKLTQEERKLLGL